jgi:O-antigen ligase
MSTSPTSRYGVVNQARLPATNKRFLQLPTRLIPLILLSQLFDYQLLDLSSFKVLFSITPDRILFLTLFFIFGCALLQGNVEPRSSSRAEVYLMFLLGFVCTSSWFISGVDFGSAKYKYLATLFNFIYFPFGVYISVKSTRYNRAATLTLLWAIVGLGTYLVVNGIFEHYGVDSLVWPKYILDPTAGIQFGRLRGPFASSVPMGEWLIVVVMSAALLTPFAQRGRKLFLYSLILLAMAGIYWTDTREVWVGFAGVVAIAAAFGRGKMRAQAFTIVLLVLVVFVVGVGSKFSLGQQTLFSRRQNTVDYRLANFSTAYKMGMDNFIFGVGYGKFLSKWREYFGPEERKLVSDLKDGNHNTYLGLFAETGICGLLVYISLLFVLILKCISKWIHLSPERHFERNFVLCAFALIIVSMNEAMFSDLRNSSPALNVLLFLFLGIVASIDAGSSEAEDTGQRFGKAKLYTPVLARNERV